MCTQCKENDLALLKSNEESAPHIRRFLRWVRQQNYVARDEGEAPTVTILTSTTWSPAVTIPLEPTDQAIEDLIEGFIELNGEV